MKIINTALHLKHEWKLRQKLNGFNRSIPYAVPPLTALDPIEKAK